MRTIPHRTVISLLATAERGKVEPMLVEVSLVHDLVDVVHDVEWWQSANISEKEYRDTVTKFKKKWLIGDRNQRLKGYIDKQTGIVRNQTYEQGFTKEEKERLTGE